MKREEVKVCEKEREEDKKRTNKEHKWKQVLKIQPNDPPNDPWFMSCQAQDQGHHWPQHEVRNSLRHRTLSSSQTIK